MKFESQQNLLFPANKVCVERFAIGCDCQADFIVWQFGCVPQCQRVPIAWRGDPDPARILHGKISVFDETTKQGASAPLLIQFMVQARLIERDESTRRFRLCPNWKQQALVVIGDGLSLDRIRQFFDDIKEITYGTVSSFKDTYLQSLVLNQALSRVVPVPGDLHTSFHQLDSIYQIFWGGFLQPICWRLGWKKVKGTDVTATYSQCRMLADLMYWCLCRLLMIDVYIHALFDVDHVSQQSLESFAIDMAKGFYSFVEDRVVNSSDWALRLVGQFFLRTFDYLLMCQSERLGDSILVEHCYARFLPVFSYTGKRNYFELCCSSEASQLSRVLGGNFQVHTVQYAVALCSNMIEDHIR